MPNASVPPSSSPPPLGKGSLQWWAAGLMFVMSMIAWLAIYGPYFQADAPSVGHDFSLLAPALLDGAVYFWKNGPFFLPWFTPAFCGGQPLLADPQSVYLSPLQWLAFVLPPMQASACFSFLCAGLAYWGFFCLARKGFGWSVWIASIAGVLGCLHGFLPHRLITGEAGFGAYALFGYIATLVLSPSRPAAIVRGGEAPSAEGSRLHGLCRRLLRWDIGAWGLGFLGANWILWGGLSLLPVALLSLMALALLKRAMTGPMPWGAVVVRCLKGGCWFVVLVAFQVSASFAVLAQFPRLSPAWPGFDSLWMAMRSTVLSLVLSGERQALLFNPALKDSPWAVFPMEWAQNFGWAPWALALLAALGLLVRRGVLHARSRQVSQPPKGQETQLHQSPAVSSRAFVGSSDPTHLSSMTRSEKSVRTLAALSCALLLFFPVLLFWHNPHWVHWLKHLPFFQSSSWPFRWTLLDVAPVGLLLAWPLGQVARVLERRANAVPLVASLVLCILVWSVSALEPRDFYSEGTLGYTGAKTIDSTWLSARANPASLDIQSIGPTLGRVLSNPSLANAQRNNLVAFGESAQLCYNPLFGYRAESDPGRQLGIGPVFPAAGAASLGMQSQSLPGVESSVGVSNAAVDAPGAHTDSKALASINLLNPACEAWPSANACKPGTRFVESQRAQALAFAQRRPFAFAVSPRQLWSERVSLVAWVLWLGIGVLSLARVLSQLLRRRRLGHFNVSWSMFTRELGASGSTRETDSTSRSPLARSHAPAGPALGARGTDSKRGPMTQPMAAASRAWHLRWTLLLAGVIGGFIAFLVVFGSSDNPLVWDDETIFSNPAYSTAAPLLPALKAGFSLFPTLYWRPLGLASLLLPLHWHWSLVAQQETREALWVLTAVLIALCGALSFVAAHQWSARHQNTPATTPKTSLTLFSGVVASAFWSLGSVNAEPAQWLSARFDLLCATFLAVWLAWAFYTLQRPIVSLRPGSRAFTSLGISALCAVAAFLSKDFAPGFFCVAVPFSVWMGFHGPRALHSNPDAQRPAATPSQIIAWAPLLGLLLGGLVGAGARRLALGSGALPQSMDGAWRLTASAASGARYVLELFNWPGLGLDRPILYWSATPAWGIGVSVVFWLVAIVVGLALLVKALRSSNFAWILVFGSLGGALFYGAMLLLGAYSSQTWVSERYLTAPLLALGLALASPLARGFGLLSAACAQGSSKARIGRLFLIFALGSMGLWGLAQSKQNQVLFSNAIEFWKHAAELPGAPIDAKNNYLSQLAGNNHSAQAIAYGEALLGHQAPSRDLIRPATNLALAYASQGEFDKALALEERFSRSGYTSAAMEANRASQFLLMGRCDEAISTLTLALNMHGTIDGPALASIKASSRPRLLAMYAVCRPQEFEAKKHDYMAAGHLSEQDLTALGLPAYIASAKKALALAASKKR